MGTNDPYQQSATGSAINWLVDLATGELALVVATIAVAVVGLMMLDGRLDWRRGARVILGCFLIFGAGTISSAFMTFGSDAAVSSGRTLASSAPQLEAQAADPNDPWAAAFLKPDTSQPGSVPLER